MIHIDNHSWDWHNIEFTNFDSHSPFTHRKTPEYVSQKETPTSIISTSQTKYNFQQKLIKLLSHDIVLHYHDGFHQLNNLYSSMENTISQFKLDFHRQECTINNQNVHTYKQFINYIDYSMPTFIDKKLIISSCTQAIMSIPLLAINQYFDLEHYVLGEIDSEVNDRTMYIDVQIDNDKNWTVHVQKPLRIFDTYGTLYCVLVDVEVDKNDLIISIRPFL